MGVCPDKTDQVSAGCLCSACVFIVWFTLEVCNLPAKEQLHMSVLPANLQVPWYTILFTVPSQTIGSHLINM